MTMNVYFVAPRRLGFAGATAALAAVGMMTAGTAAASRPSSASVANGTLTINGTNQSDRLALRLQAGDAGTLQVDFGDDGSAEHSFDRGTFGRIDVLLSGGDDEFRVDQVNGALADEALTVDGGSGDDTLDGGDGIELFVGGSGDDAVDGNRADDTALLGAGSDTFRWDPGDGSDVVEGESGHDTLDFNGNGASETMSLSDNGGRSVFLRDVANIRMDMDDVERLDLTALGGIDTITVGDLSGTDVRVVDVDLSGPGGGGDAQVDVVRANGTPRADKIDVATEEARVDVDGLTSETRITGSETVDVLQVNTLGGNDDVDVDGDVFARITVAVDLGPDQI
jgi:hypothetical protein